MAIEWTTLLDFSKSVADNATKLATATAAIGVLSMAIIQTLKDMLPLRNWFQQWWLKGWLRDRASKAARTGGKAPDVKKAEDDLIRLATAGDRAAFYDLAIEQLCGQMNAAAQVVLEYPADHGDLLRCLAALAETADLDSLLAPPPDNSAAPSKIQAQVDARTRVIHQVQRSIDGFQISAGFRWKWILQIVSFAVSFALTLIGFSLHAGSEGLRLSLAWSYLLAGLLGGFLAPVARDLVASLQKLRA
jgi:hypothetical protein